MSEIHSLIKKLKEKNLTIALVESVTCGMASHRLSNVKGVSDVLKGSVVCYTPEVKIELMGITQTMIDKYTCESMQVTEALATKLTRLMKADIHAGITGLASPGGSETKTKPVGTIFFCICYRKKIYKMKKIMKGTPLEIKKEACTALFNFILSKI
jgi:nicotinamide-nucleotide amidase